MTEGYGLPTVVTEPGGELSPIYLFADSQLLFWKQDEVPFLRTILRYISAEPPKAAYVGLSNGNVPEFFEIFKCAMEGLGISNCRMLSQEFGREDSEFLEESNVVLLSGGDTIGGWQAISACGLREGIVQRYLEGAVLIGISAGAVQLGLCTAAPTSDSVIPTLGLVPFVVGAHDEHGWHDLQRIMRLAGQNGPAKGLGIPSGGGLAYHPDHSLTPLRKTVHEFCADGPNLSTSILMSSEDTDQPSSWRH
jgi:peptidase E